MQLEHILQAHGLVGRGTKVVDLPPPPPVTNFKATEVGVTAKLDWTNPVDTGFVSVRILRKTGGYSAGLNDGVVVYEGDGETYTDSNIDLGVTYYYRAFTLGHADNANTDTGQQVNIKVKDTQTAPSAPIMASRTSTSVTLNAISGCEYCRGTGSWQDSTTFSGLDIATEYTFYARKKETETHYASPISSGTKISTDKAGQVAPVAPTISNIKYDRATVTSVSNAEVRLDSGSWYDSPHTFTGLTLGQEYTAYARMKETSIYYASPASTGKKFTPDKEQQTAPPKPEVIVNNFDDVEVIGETGTEVRIDSGTWYDSPHTYTNLDAETEYYAYARRKETASHYASPSSSAEVFETPPEADDVTGSPGPVDLIAGDMQEGFFGECPANELFTGTELASEIGLSAGTVQFSDEPWLKFAFEGNILFVAKKTYRYSISWDHINTANAVYGDKTVEKDGLTYKVRLMRGALTDPSAYTDNDRGAHGSEWNRLMLPIHEQAIGKSWAYPQYAEEDIPVWEHEFGAGAQKRYTDIDLQVISAAGNGYYTWCQETRGDNASLRVNRGYIGVSYSFSNTASSSTASGGWRPCLEVSS